MKRYRWKLPKAASSLVIHFQSVGEFQHFPDISIFFMSGQFNFFCGNFDAKRNLIDIYSELLFLLFLLTFLCTKLLSI